MLLPAHLDLLQLHARDLRERKLVDKETPSRDNLTHEHRVLDAVASETSAGSRGAILEARDLRVVDVVLLGLQVELRNVVERVLG